MTRIRRRTVLLMAAAAGLATLPVSVLARSQRLYRWRGVLLGADAELVIAHEDAASARELALACVDEARRLERIFSLFDDDSALSRLNRAGRLTAPPPELVEVLSLSRRVWSASEGAFDPTIQPLWDLYAGAFGQGSRPSRAEVERAIERVGFDKVSVSAEAIEFARPHMALTLNGIAQGWITDRVADLLRENGLPRALVQLGETRALGRRPDGEPWSVALAGAARDGERRPAMALDDTALAVSSPGATPLSEERGINHMIDPATGGSPPEDRLAVVKAARASVADALSTALALRGPGLANGVRDWDGVTAWIGDDAETLKRIHSS